MKISKLLFMIGLTLAFPYSECIKNGLAKLKKKSCEVYECVKGHAQGTIEHLKSINEYNIRSIFSNIQDRARSVINKESKVEEVPEAEEEIDEIEKENMMKEFEELMKKLMAMKQQEDGEGEEGEEGEYEESVDEEEEGKEEVEAGAEEVRAEL
ncbi:hypothetical protein TCON_0315 [Astathelohania contejeani]|uniref:Uncharacterized protein n=1 Tax=Astathelohania contejeani TaxID=164912 RepID=A0ABQ7I218_9MICR|nr:hypothetical protein TCON_0315 [Thelohania contejeani]